MKRLLSLLTTLTLIIGMLPLHAAADTRSQPVYQTGNVNIQSTVNNSQVLKDSFYYTDEWFFEDPSVRNDALALVSMQAVASAADHKADGSGAAFLKKLGFGSIGFAGFETGNPEDCAFIYGTKTIKKGSETSTLAAVIIVSYTLEQDLKQKGWEQNFTVNDTSSKNDPEGEHYAFSLAADKALKNNISELSNSSKTKIWITGQSRGGAIAGIIASKLPRASTYAYTFEAPTNLGTGTGTDKEAVLKIAEGYTNIHNYLCNDDIVTMLPPEKWGMTRYGVSHVINVHDDKYTPAGIQDELTELGSQAAYITEMENKEESIKKLMDSMTDAVPTRAEYSRKQTLPNKATHSYQDALIHLMESVFGNEFANLTIFDFLGQSSKLAPALDDLARGIDEKSDADYWSAAVKLKTILDSMAKTSLDERDIYLLLKLVGPALIDTRAKGSTESAGSRVVSYLSPLTSLYLDKDSFVYSHHFDTLIARFKKAAPSPVSSQGQPVDDPSGKTGKDDANPTPDQNDSNPTPGQNDSDPTAGRDTGTNTGNKGQSKSQPGTDTGKESRTETPLPTFAPLKLKSVKQGKAKITLSWQKAGKSSSYVVYGNQYGKKGMTKIATVKKTSCAVSKVDKKIKSGTYYIFYVSALNEAGKPLYRSAPVYVTAKGKKYGNYKSVKLTGKYTKKATVKTGSSIKIKASEVKPSGKTAIKQCTGIRYESSDPYIAAVSAKGVVKGKKKGTCTVYAYAQNGTENHIKVTVK